MKNFEIKALGMEEISSQEAVKIDGGTTIRYYTGDNPLVYAGNAVVNGCKYLIHGVKKLFGSDDELKYETFS